MLKPVHLLEEGESAKEAFTKHDPLSPELWEAHLRGDVSDYALGIVPTTKSNMAYFGAIDIDDDGIDLLGLERKVRELELPLVVCRSKSGGAHLYVFLRDPVPCKTLIEKLKRWATSLGHAQNSNGKTTEIFPKQDKLKKTEDGSWINIPYFRESNTTRYCVTLDPVYGEDDARLDFEQFLLYAEDMSISAAELDGREAKLVGGEDLFTDAPPCLQKLHQIGYPDGVRNQGLYNVAVFFKLAFPDDWQARLEEYNAESEKIDPPVSDRDLKALIRSIDGRDYVYKCSELPISAHCEKSKCKKQKFGIMVFQRQRVHDLFPELTALVKIMTDPPRWQMSVNGQSLDLTTDDLMTLVKFRKVCMERLSIIVPIIKQFEWDEMIRELLVDHKVVSAPEDAGVFGQFQYLVREFLTYRAKSESREDLLSGKPYEEEGRVYFRSSDLLGFLDRRKFRSYQGNQVFTELRRLGVGHHQFNIRKACVQVWWLPVPEGEQREDFSVPVDQEPKF